MIKQSRKLMLASGIALAIAATGSTWAEESGTQSLTEARQETQIWTTYALSPYLRASDLKVSVNDGKATVTGVVDEGVNKDLAKQIALGVDGITEVDNQIVVQHDYAAPATSSSRSYGEKIDDASISAAVKSKLAWSKYTDGLVTEVETRSGKVVLTGTSDSTAAKDLATRLAMNTRGVLSVDNQLRVVSGKPVADAAGKTPVQKAERDINDGWITTKVKSTFMYSRYVDSSDISVTTNSGVVTLSGKVSSGAERALAKELAENVLGVKSVRADNLIF